MIISIFNTRKDLNSDRLYHLLDRPTRFIDDKHFVTHNNKEYEVFGRVKQNLPQDYIVLESSV